MLWLDRLCQAITINTTSNIKLEAVMSDTYTELKAIVKDLLGADEAKITMEARFREDLEADSLDLVELIMAFEDKFGAEISDEDAQKITTVGDAVTYIEATRSNLLFEIITVEPPDKGGSLCFLIGFDCYKKACSGLSPEQAFG
jgi:acyl carrier protein